MAEIEFRSSCSGPAGAGRARLRPYRFQEVEKATAGWQRLVGLVELLMGCVRRLGLRQGCGELLGEFTHRAA
jgi:hypothetical protein